MNPQAAKRAAAVEEIATRKETVERKRKKSTDKGIKTKTRRKGRGKRMEEAQQKKR